MMATRYAYAVLIEIAASSICGIGAGALLMAANRFYEMSVVYLVLLSVPSNLLVALAVYIALRGAVALADAGVIFGGLLCLIHLVTTLGVAAWYSGFLGSGASLPGTHAFTWGLGYAYIEALRDTRDGKWFGESSP